MKFVQSGRGAVTGGNLERKAGPYMVYAREVRCANSCFERFLGLQCGEKTFRVYMRSDMRVFPTFNSN